MRGAHHRRCAREGLTAAIMPYGQGQWQAHKELYVSPTGYISSRQHILNVVHMAPDYDCAQTRQNIS